MAAPAEPPLVIIVHIPPLDADNTDVARDLHGRPAHLRALAREIGVALEVIEARELLAAAPGAEPIAGALQQARAAWWMGRIAFLPETTALFAALRAHAAAAGRPDLPLFDDPEDVEEAFSLERFYPVLERAGVAQAATRLLPLSAAEAAAPEADVAATLARRVAAAGIRFDAGPLFFRSWYGTLKIAGGLNGAFSAEDFAESAAALVARLRVGQPIGGIAVRETLPIPIRFFNRRRALVRREFRVFCVAGEPRIWLLAGDHGDYQVAKISRDALADVARLSPAEHASMRDQARRAAQALRVRFLVADFTALDDGRVVCLETNPAHACGWCHPATFIGAYAPLLRGLAGLAPLDPAGRPALAAALGIDLGGEGKTFGFFDPPTDQFAMP